MKELTPTKWLVVRTGPGKANWVRRTPRLEKTLAHHQPRSLMEGTYQPHIPGTDPRESRITQADIDKIMQAIRELGETHKRGQDANNTVLDVHNSALASLTEMIQKLDERDQLRGAAIDSLVEANRELLGLVQSLMQRVENLEKPPDNSYRIGDFRPPR